MSNQELAELAEEYYQWTLRTQPIMATLRGIHDYDTEIGEVSREAEDRRISELRDMAQRASAFDPNDLDESDRITREVLIFEAETHADSAETRMAELFVNHTSGYQALIPVVIPQLPIETAEHGDDFVERFSKLPELMGDLNGRLAEGVAHGRTPMASTAEKTVAQIDTMLEAPIEADPFMTARRPSGIDEAAWRERLADLVRDHVRPAMQAHRDKIANDVIPAGRSDDRPGLSWLPDGEETYAVLVRQHTSLPLDPEEIHRIGLHQIEKLDDEYRELGAQVLGTTDLATIYSQLRDDPDLHFEVGADIVNSSEIALAKAKDEMSNWFGRLPEADCLVAETPLGPAAFYFPAAIDGSRPGIFFINTAEPSQWDRYSIEALTYHEGIPGHHLQISIAQELEDIPDFRKHSLVTVYAEGWGLYSERLADEMGLYSGPLERIGMLSHDSMRAGRLVVDTGIHAMGWSRQKSIDFFLQNSPMTLRTIEEEVDRYVGSPGQALAYMIGRLEILRMRGEAEEALGEKFDIKGFHDAVLGSGLVPMGTLDRIVKNWVDVVASS